jgi:hypothetical protein
LQYLFLPGLQIGLHKLEFSVNNQKRIKRKSRRFD